MILRSPINLFRNWRESRRALRELAHLQESEFAILELDGNNLVNRAKVSLDLGDHAAANAFWERALLRYPAFARQHNDALWILIGLKRFDEAEALTADRLKRFPREMTFAEDHAQVPQERGDTDEAIRRWAEVRRKHSLSSKAYVQGVICLIRAHQADAAEQLAEQAIKRFSGVEPAWMEWARSAENRQDWPEALRRWEAADQRFKHAIVDLGIAGVLVELGRLEEADARLVEAQSRTPLWTQMVIARARIAKLRDDKEAEALLWAEGRRRFPLSAFGYENGFRLLLDMGRIEEAEQVLLAAIERFPTEAWPAEEYAEIATRQHDWAAAETRWATVRAKWPDRERAYRLGAEALVNLGRPDDASQLQFSPNGQRAAT